MGLSSSKYDALIIGGGHNGLTAGAYLARAGLKVLILEGRDRAGGLCSELELFPGYRGAMPNSPGSLQPVIVADLELETHGLKFVRPDPSLVFPFPDGTAFIGWRDKRQAYDQLAQFSKKDAEAYFKFFAYLEDFASRLNLSPFAAAPPLAKIIEDLLPSDQPLLHALLFGNARTLIEEWFESEQVRALVASVPGTQSVSGPSFTGNIMKLLMRPLWSKLTQSSFSHDPRQGLLRGSTGLPLGGMGSIAKALANSFRAAGGDLKLNARVKSIHCSDNFATAVTTADGETYSAKRILSAINIQSTICDLLDQNSADDGLRKEIKKLRMRGSNFKVGLALSAAPIWSFAANRSDALQLSACQFRIAPSLEIMDEAAVEAQSGYSSRHPLLWGLTPSISDPTLTPRGRHVMSINAVHAPYYLAPGLSWKDERDKFGNRCIEVLGQYVLNLKDIIIDKRFWSPEDINDEYLLVGADNNHGDMLARGMLGSRPAPGWTGYKVPSVDRLYICGSSAWPGGAITGLPGRNAALEVLSDVVAESQNKKSIPVK